MSLHLIAPVGIRGKTRPACSLPNAHTRGGKDNVSVKQHFRLRQEVEMWSSSCAKAQVTQGLEQTPVLFGLDTPHYSLESYILPLCKRIRPKASKMGY